MEAEGRGQGSRELDEMWWWWRDPLVLRELSCIHRKNVACQFVIVHKWNFQFRAFLETPSDIFRRIASSWCLDAFSGRNVLRLGIGVQGRNLKFRYLISL